MNLVKVTTLKGVNSLVVGINYRGRLMLIEQENIMGLGFRVCYPKKRPSRTNGNNNNLLWSMPTIREGTTIRLHYTRIHCTSTQLF
jgi:hypothetical protein